MKYDMGQLFGATCKYVGLRPAGIDIGCIHVMIFSPLPFVSSDAGLLHSQPISRLFPSIHRAALVTLTKRQYDQRFFL